VADVVVRLTQDQLRKLHTLACNEVLAWQETDARDREEQWDGIEGLLQAALDSPSVEEEQFRVVFRLGKRQRKSTCKAISRTHALERASRIASGDRCTEVQPQGRTITTFSDGSSLISPWADLPSEKGER
jgi:hypothetical protein